MLPITIIVIALVGFGLGLWLGLKIGWERGARYGASYGARRGVEMYHAAAKARYADRLATQELHTPHQ